MSDMRWGAGRAAAGLVALVVCMQIVPPAARTRPDAAVGIANGVVALPVATPVHPVSFPTPTPTPSAMSAVGAPPPAPAARRTWPPTASAGQPQLQAVASPQTRPSSLPPPPRPAVSTVRAAGMTPAPSVSPTQTGAEALARIRYPWAGLGYQLTFHGPRDGFFGLTDCINRRIDIYVTPDQDVAKVAFVTAFEIAHAVDCTRLSSDRQTRWAGLRGFRLNGPWFPPCACAEDSYPSGDFAEVFARWQAGPVYPWRSTLAPAPAASQLQALIPFLES